jgi:hypothetical protein
MDYRPGFAGQQASLYRERRGSTGEMRSIFCFACALVLNDSLFSFKVLLGYIFDSANAALRHYSWKPLEWGEVREACEELLNPKGLVSYAKRCQELKCDDLLQDEWRRLGRVFDGEGTKDIDASDHEGLMAYHAKNEAYAEEARDKQIAYHQLKAYSEYIAKNATTTEVEA